MNLLESALRHYAQDCQKRKRPLFLPHMIALTGWNDKAICRALQAVMKVTATDPDDCRRAPRSEEPALPRRNGPPKRERKPHPAKGRPLTPEHRAKIAAAAQARLLRAAQAKQANG